MIEKHNTGEICARLKAEFLKEMEQPEPVFSTALPQPNEWTLPSLSYGPSKEVPSFSSAVSLQYSKELGRHLVANRDIKTGNFGTLCLVKEETQSFCFP